MNLPLLKRRKTGPWPLRTAVDIVRYVLQWPVFVRQAVDPAYPWLCHGSVSLLRQVLAPDMRGFEWGAGRSTEFFARHAAHLVSVEHEAKWIRRVRVRLGEAGLGHKATLLFLPRNSHGAKPDSRPELWLRLNLQPRHPELAAYFDAVLDWPESFFDFISIDGRARVECAANAVSRLKPGGLLILDNSEWTKYGPVFTACAGWPRRCFCNGVWETTVFWKPDSSRIYRKRPEIGPEEW